MSAIFDEFEKAARRLRNGDPETYEYFIKVFRGICNDEVYRCVGADAAVVLINQGQARMALSLLKSLEKALQDPTPKKPAPE